MPGGGAAEELSDSELFAVCLEIEAAASNEEAAAPSQADGRPCPGN